jgi:hypothetical protein
MSILGQTHTSHCTHRNARAMPQTPGTTHHHRFGQLPHWKADLLRHTTIYEEHIHLLTSKSRIAVTDGGMEGGKGHFGVIIAVGKIVIACARGAARGDPRTMDSFRAEACGFLAGTCLLQLLTAAHPADQPDQTHTDSIHTDSASLLSRLERATSEHIPTGFWLKPDSGIIMQLAEELKPIHSLQRMCVKGHQDSTNRSADLTLPELCNVEADAEAAIMRFQMQGPASSVVPFPASIVNTCIQHQLMHSSLNSLLHEELTQADYWTYLEEKFHWTTTTRQLIDWNLYHKLLNNQPHKHHQQLIKYSVEWLPTGYEVHRNNVLEEHRCPHCKTVFERNAHLLRCPHPERAASFVSL